ncbi:MULTISPECIES: hypothetical protein [Streptomyces]|uniref:Uncharacterized protein n=2 Tax=Streptomyces TaxID=1883 RepID=A0ABV9J1Z8_9ACTN
MPLNADRNRWAAPTELVGLAGAAAAQAASGGGLRWRALLAHSLPPLAVALLTGAFGRQLSAGAAVWLLVAATLWGLRGYLGRLTRDETGPRAVSS